MQGAENLKGLLSRLPEGEAVTWIGGGWLQAVGTPSGDIRLPDGEMIDEIESWCQDQSIQLSAASGAPAGAPAMCVAPSV